MMDECQVSVYDSDECSINFDAFLNTAELDEESCNRSDSCSRVFQNSSVVDSENVEQSSHREAINQAILTLFASMGKWLDIIKKQMCIRNLLAIVK